MDTNQRSNGHVDVTLHPGDLLFYRPDGRRTGKLKTLLGSCVSVVLWHPKIGFAGMSHGVLPSRPRKTDTHSRDSRYCDDAVAQLAREIEFVGALPKHFHAYVIGGGQSATSQLPESKSIGSRNVDITLTELRRRAFVITGTHVGGSGYRRVELDLGTGFVQVTGAGTDGNVVVNG